MTESARVIWVILRPLLGYLVAGVLLLLALSALTATIAFTLHGGSFAAVVDYANHSRTLALSFVVLLTGGVIAGWIRSLVVLRRVLSARGLTLRQFSRLSEAEREIVLGI
jgi:hypothetical protein